MKKIMSALFNNFYISKYLLHHAPLYISLGVSYAIITGLRSVYLNMYMVKYVLTSVEEKQPFSEVLIFLIFSLVILAAAYLLEALWLHVIKPIYSEKISTKMQIELFETSVKIPLKEYDHPQTYDDFILAMKSGNIATTVFDNHLRLIQSISTIVAIIGLAATMDLAIVVLALVSFAVSMFTNLYLAERQADYSMKLQLVDRKDGYIRRIFYLKDYQKDLKLFDLSGLLFKRITATKLERKEVVKTFGKKIGFLKFVNSFILEAVLIDFFAVFYLTYRILISKVLNIGSFMALINGCYALRFNLNFLVDNISLFYQNSIYIARYRDFGKNNTAQSIENGKGVKKSFDRFKSLRLKDVCFHYDGGFSLKDVNLEIKRGQKIAIVGYNGSGKSTLVKLLAQLYVPDVGVVIVNDEIISLETVEWAQNQFHVLFQDAELYCTSIIENIVLDTDINVNQAKKAIIKSDLSELISKLPQIENTQISKEFDEEGRNFSGGERQRLMLSRVFYQNKDIIILDEPNSALDVETEDLFYKQLIEHEGDKTIIFVSHRLSSVLKCDKIFMLEDGAIIEEGTHAQLMDQSGKYAEIFNAQSSWYTA